MPSESFVVKTWRRTDGLPQSTVTALARTSDGYLWIGTYGGLARFDGVRFVQFGLPDGLRSLNVRALLPAEDGGVWVATLGGGLSRVGSDGAISTLTTADGLLQNEVTALARASGGGLWVGTARGLQRWTPGSGFVRIGEADGVSGTIMALAVTAEGLWGTEGGRGLFLCRGDGRCERIAEPVEQTQKRALFASSFLVDASGDLWVGMGNGVIIRRHAGRWTELNKADGVPFSVITRFALGPDGTVWAGTNEAGIHRFHDGRFIPVPETGPTVRALMADADGIIWAGLEGGGLLRLTRARVTAYRVGENDRQGRVNGLAEEPTGELWVATFGRGLFHGPPDKLAPVAGFATATPLRAALRMSDGTVYVSGYRRLGRRDPATGEVRSWQISDDPGALCEGADGTLWAGTQSGQLKRLAGDAFEAVPNGTFGYPVTGIAHGPGAALWVATRGAGLFRWENGQTRRWTTADGLPTDHLQALYPDADGTLWIGTAGGGIAWLDTVGRVRAVGLRQGLGDDVISQILDDGRGNLWMGGLRGLRRLPKAELRAVADGQTASVHPLVLDESDGMSSAECTAGFAPAGLRARSGIMYFSTDREVVAIDPSAFNPQTNPPAVLIESVRCDGREQPLGNAGSKIVLPPGSDEVEIEYTGFDGAKPEQLRFRHRLLPHGAWQYVEGTRDVRFSALQPGDYAFELSAARADGHWLEPGVRLAITIQPHFWQTATFRVAAVVGLIAVAAVMVLIAWRRKERQHQIELAHQRALADAERELAVQRDELAHLSRVTMLGELSGSMAHELNQPLTSIMCNAQAALKFLESPSVDLAEVNEILQDIMSADRRAGDVIHRLRRLFHKGEMVLQRLDAAEVVRDTLRLMRSDLSARGVVAHDELADALPPIRGDRVQLQQVLINLIINACDAMSDMSPSERRLTIRAAPGRFAGVRLSVTDNGPGISPDRLELVFQPFVTTKPDGMGLGLAVCRTIVTAQGGMLFADPHPAGGGATFVIDLPAAESETVSAA